MVAKGGAGSGGAKKPAGAKAAGSGKRVAAAKDDRPGLFLGFAREDIKRADAGWPAGRFQEKLNALTQALNGQGIRVWRDRQRLDSFESIDRFWRQRLPSSRAALLLASRAYLSLPACQWEQSLCHMLASHMARQADQPGEASGIFARRLMLLSPGPVGRTKGEGESSGLLPPFHADMTADETEALARVLAEIVQGLEGNFPRQVPGMADGIPRGGLDQRAGQGVFVGRWDEMLSLQESLAPCLPFSDPAEAPDPAAGEDPAEEDSPTAEAEDSEDESPASASSRLLSGAALAALAVRQVQADDDADGDDDRDDPGQSGGASGERPALAMLYGVSGAGKSLLAEEFAERFAPAWPGGIFRLCLGQDRLAEGGKDSVSVPSDKPSLVTERGLTWPADPDLRLMMTEGYRKVARGLKLPQLARSDPEALRRGVDQALLAGQEAFLWIIEDIPPGCDPALLRLLSAPPVRGADGRMLGATLITGREAPARRRKSGDSAAGPGGMRLIRLEGLADYAARSLLSGEAALTSPADIQAGKALLASLDNHALAVDACARFLQDLPVATLDKQLRKTVPPGSPNEIPGQPGLISSTGPVGEVLFQALAHLSDAARDLLLRAGCFTPGMPVPRDMLCLVTLLRRAPLFEKWQKQAAALEGQALQTRIFALPADIRGLNMTGLLEIKKELDVAAEELAARALCQVRNDSLILHPLVYQLLRDRFPALAEERAAWQEASRLWVLSVVIGNASSPTHMQFVSALAPLYAPLLQGRKDLLTAALLVWTGFACGSCGDLVAGEQAERRAVEIVEAAFGEDHPETLVAKSNLAETLRQREQLKPAMALLEQVIEGHRKTSGPEHPETLASMNSLADLLLAGGKPDTACRLQEKVLEGRKRVLGPDNPDTRLSMNNLAVTLRQTGRLNEARELQEQVLDSCRRHPGPDQPETLTAMNNLAITLAGLSRLEEARDLQEQVVEKRQQHFGPDHPESLLALDQLARTFALLGQKKAALTLARRALQGREERLGPDHRDSESSRAFVESLEKGSDGGKKA